MLQTVSVATSTGRLNFGYYICTPSDVHSKSIDPSLPTLLFLHSEYTASEAWQNQFSSSLRRFNMISLDLRAHGETGGKCPSTYSRVYAAEDIAGFMNALKLPPCHIVGNSIGSDIAIQVAVTFPEKVASVTLIGIVPDEEDPAVSAGRQEIFDYWYEGCTNNDEQATADAVLGCLQLLYNNIDSSLARALLQINVPRARKNWGGLNGLDSLNAISVRYFTNARTPRTVIHYSKITCPVLIIHSLDDIVAPLSMAEDLEHSLQDAGVLVQTVHIKDAPRFAPVTHPKPVNTAIEKFILSKFCPNGSPPIPKKMNSPWEKAFENAGYVQPGLDVDSDGSDEDLTLAGPALALEELPRMAREILG